MAGKIRFRYTDNVQTKQTRQGRIHKPKTQEESISLKAYTEIKVPNFQAFTEETTRVFDYPVHEQEAATRG